ncbi:MAG: hypothetical protein ACUVS1_07890 [Actinomycetota bacterium]
MPSQAEEVRFMEVRTSDRFPGVEWVGDPGDFIRVDESRCDSCANCVRVCLAECFEIREKKARVRTLAECMECAACWYVCDKEAIIFSWPPGGTGFRTDWG